MALRTGADYLRSLRDGRQVYLDGRLIEDITKEPGLREVAETFARMYDLVCANPDTMTFREDGEVFSGSWLEPRNREQLAWRRRYTETIARHTGGLFGRSQEYVPLFHLGMLDVKHIMGSEDPRFIKNIEDYWKMARAKDLMLSHAFATVTPPAGVALIDSCVVKMVEQNDKGIVVRGSKTIGTFAAHSDECFVGTQTSPGISPEHVIYFSVPMATKGLKIIARTPYGVGSAFDHPVGQYGDENDCILVFDDVFVPWERVFLAGGDPSVAFKVFPPMSKWAHWDVITRLAVKAEVLLGVFSLLAEMLGRDKNPATQTAIAETIRYLTTIRAFVMAGEDGGSMTEGGYYAPDQAFIMTGRAYSVEHYRRIVSQLHEIATQSLVNIPTEAAFANPDIRADLETIFANPVGTAQDRVRITRLGWDMTCDAFGARQTLFELLNSAPWEITRSTIFARFDTKPYKDLASAVAGLGDLEAAARQVDNAVMAGGNAAVATPPVAKPAPAPVKA